MPHKTKPPFCRAQSNVKDPGSDERNNRLEQTSPIDMAVLSVIACYPHLINVQLWKWTQTRRMRKRMDFILNLIDNPGRFRTRTRSSDSDASPRIEKRDVEREGETEREREKRREIEKEREGNRTRER